MVRVEPGPRGSDGQWSGLPGDLFAVLVLEFADTLLERSDLEVAGVGHHDDRHVRDRRLDALGTVHREVGGGQLVGLIAPRSVVQQVFRGFGLDELLDELAVRPAALKAVLAQPCPREVGGFLVDDQGVRVVFDAVDLVCDLGARSGRVRGPR